MLQSTAEAGCCLTCCLYFVPTSQDVCGIVRPSWKARSDLPFHAGSGLPTLLQVQLRQGVSESAGHMGGAIMAAGRLYSLAGLPVLPMSCHADKVSCACKATMMFVRFCCASWHSCHNRFLCHSAVQLSARGGRMQVLVSIQSMILVKDPWFNEPGREGVKDIASSERYNRQMQRDTLLHAVLPALTHPPAEFADVLR